MNLLRYAPAAIWLIVMMWVGAWSTLGVILLLLVWAFFLRIAAPRDGFIGRLLHQPLHIVRTREGTGQPSRGDYARYAAFAGVAYAVWFAVYVLLEPSRHGLMPVVTAYVVSVLFLLAAVRWASQALSWQQRPNLPYVILFEGCEVAETQLEHRELEHGTVGGEVRPLRAFAAAADTVRDLSHRLRCLDTPSERIQLLRDGAVTGRWEVRARHGGAVPAHNVTVVDLGLLGSGSGYWVELTVPDTSVWEGTVVGGELREADAVIARLEAEKAAEDRADRIGLMAAGCLAILVILACVILIAETLSRPPIPG